MAIKATALNDPSEDGNEIISALEPYMVRCRIEGVSAILFHRWSVESVAEKAAAAKGSAAKKSDDVDSYVWRNDGGVICLPAEYVRRAMVNAARFRQDPRSPRKSAMELYAGGIQWLTELAPITKVTDEVATTWDYLDRRRVTVQRAGITRTRPAFLAGWTAELEFTVSVPHYIGMADFRDVLAQAGTFVGVGDFRPSYGRFQVVSCEKIVLE